MNKLKILLMDIFFIISGIVGVGFATGKEISHFFISGRSIVIACLVFFVVFSGLSIYFLHIKNKYNINSLTQLNKLAFGKHYKVCNVLMIILFLVTNSAMLAGCDNLAKTYLGLNVPICSVVLSCITFFIVLGGVDRIKNIANIIMPILIIVIIINAFGNMDGNVSLVGNYVLDIIYPIIFCCENFIILISVLLATKSKPKILTVVSGVIISIIVLICAFAIGNLNADMPMLILSSNFGKMFFSIYLVGVIFALFTTLEITTYNCLEVSNANSKNARFILFIVLSSSQILAYLGFNFIVQYLYTFMGILSSLYLIVLIIKLIIKNK